jgi:hypothetical protein
MALRKASEGVLRVIIVWPSGPMALIRNIVALRVILLAAGKDSQNNEFEKGWAIAPLKSNQKCVSAETGANSNEVPFLTVGRTSFGAVAPLRRGLAPCTFDSSCVTEANPSVSPGSFRAC